MSYVVIATDGTLHLRGKAVTIEQIRAEVGDWDMVRLDPFPVRGFVNDTGLIDGTERNVVGAIMLMSCNGPEQPYAGPVLITGWDEYREIEALSADMVQSLQTLHGCIVKALAGDDSCPTCRPEWREEARAAAAMVRTTPARPIQVISLDEWAGGVR